MHAERVITARMSRSRLDKFEGLDRTGTAWAVVDAMGRCVDIGIGQCRSSESVNDRLAEALECARMEASVAILAELRARHS